MMEEKESRSAVPDQASGMPGKDAGEAAKKTEAVTGKSRGIQADEIDYEGAYDQEECHQAD